MQSSCRNILAWKSAVRKERIPVRGLKLSITPSRSSRIRSVRKERIPVRGLKLMWSSVIRSKRSTMCQKRTNPREGIETKYRASARAKIQYGQKRTNPREGIETLPVVLLSQPDRLVRKERIPVRGLKPVGSCSVSESSKYSVRKERIPVRGLKPRSRGYADFISDFSVRKERIPVRGLKLKRSATIRPEALC